ncbi:DUF5329 family protein [Aureibaculum sp. A20]|uniref:DUF5329 family protein n=1 Tax=Aureibaculum flavum TaxID=2795986 RepID=A0ABS0WV21_9FLAO|nr:DUF5329 family protein [Aureibaculum flavum]MBJ2175846.1 DUF5329 family protein [Aureibaculum flavum]
MKYLKITSTLLIVIILNSCSKTDGLAITNDNEIKIAQRGSKVIKGSEGDVELILNDITGGSTEVSIVGIENNQTYYKNYLGEGEYGVFQYGKYFYRVKINSFEEHIFHDDYAFITFRTVSEEKGKAEAQIISNEEEIPITPKEIRAYLNKIKTSGFKFIRSDEVWSDSIMSNHLENKYILNSKDIKTRSDFINKVAKSSSLTGEQYNVITQNSDTIAMVKWLGL